MAALGLLFEKVYLPNNIEFIVDFAEKFKIKTVSDRYKNLELTSDFEDPFAHLSESQQENAYKYMQLCLDFAIRNHELFDDVIETNAFDGGVPLHAELVKEGGFGELNTYKVTRVPLTLVGESAEEMASRIQSGYVPVIGNMVGPKMLQQGVGTTAKELAALLAIKSVEMLFPATKSVPAEVILEARDKLRDQLPLFWSAMFTLSVELKAAIEQCKEPMEISAVGVELVDTLVRPALTDLNHKIELERKQWFRRIFGGVFKALKVAAANPPITQDQLIRSSLILGANAAIDLSDHFNKIEAIKSQAGLTYLLDLSALSEKKHV
jgi:hypothetical protein